MVGVAHTQADGVSEESVQTHAGSLSVGNSCVDGTQESTDEGTQAGTDKDTVVDLIVHDRVIVCVAFDRIGIGKVQGVQDQDVGQGDEGGQAGQHLSFDVGASFAVAKEVVQRVFGFAHVVSS